MTTMNRYFNIAGPCNPKEHYMLPAETRCREAMDLIQRKQYFVIHAARQSGKTTLLFDLVDKLNLMAFLRNITGRDGFINREMASGRGRTVDGKVVHTVGC